MTTASTNTPPHIDAELSKLRLELKAWEQAFAAAHQGRKAARHDIKQCPEIDQKYRQYHNLRYPSAKRPLPQAVTPSKKRGAISSHSPPPPPSSSPPIKRQKHTQSVRPQVVDVFGPPTSTHPSPTTHRTSIGPTPQKDGQVLGLFDLPLSISELDTPSKRFALRSVENNIVVTPSRRTPMGHGGSAGTMDFKAPPGASNSNHLGNLLTPSTRRIRSSCTPGSRSGVRKLRFDDTPAFLRRDSRHAHVGKENFDGDEGEELSWSPVAVRKITRPAGRGLSALVKGLREMEDDQLDEDLDILRERENDTALSSKIDQTQTLVKDSQRYDMPLGPDGGFESDENDGKYEDEGKGRDGNPLKVWKKKGQKRTTRRILLKPNTEKWKPETAWKGGCDGDAEEVCVAETQIANAEGKRECQSGMFNSDKTSEEQAIRGVEKLSNGEKEAKDICEKKGSIAKTVKKKISATAHANFRALKIKNKQSKAKGRRRFGGRR